MTALPLTFVPVEFSGSVVRDEGEAPLPGAAWYTAQAVEDELIYCVPKGALASARYLVADMLLDGRFTTSFALTLQESGTGRIFGMNFGLLNQCQARMRIPLEAVNQNRWRYDREGAWLKPRCRYGRVDLAQVDRMTLRIMRKSDEPSRWCMTPIVATAEEPPLLEKPLLPKGPLLDELGQSTLHDWPGKSRSPAEVTARLQAQLRAAPAQCWPEGFSRWGGWIGKRFQATGYFRTHHDGSRWWLVDPDGYAFWSSGLDCVRLDTPANYGGLEAALTWLPDKDGPYAAVYEERDGFPLINYLKANLIRAFGSDDWYDKWAEIVLGELRRVGFNTVANWSEWQIAREAGIPYVRFLLGRELPMRKVYRDLPDVFAPEFAEVAAAYAEPLRETADDPAMIGYFMMNEPSWGFASETPAAGMLLNTPSCASRAVLSDFLRQRYGSARALSRAWEVEATFARIAEGEWTWPLNEKAEADLADFSQVMVTRFFGGLNDACRAVDPNHLNLGVRYQSVPPHWAVEGMRTFDVFSMNCYRPRVPAEQMSQISAMLNMPVVIGEWHFGALDVGLPASGIGRVRDQAARGKAFRVYAEDAAAKPWCVGVHYFTLYDQSALGRFDGENYQIGFLDVCHRPYEPLAEAARATHERLYQVASGQVAPFDDAPEYLPMLFL